MNLLRSIDQAFSLIKEQQERISFSFNLREYGEVVYVQKGIVYVKGLFDAGSEELLQFAGSQFGMVLGLEKERIGVVLLDQSEEIEAKMEVYRTGRVISAPVGEELLGRVVDPIGRPLDVIKAPLPEKRRAVEQPAPQVTDRLPVEVPLQTGIQAIDAMIPIGRGQRELILGDRQTGKTAIAIDTIINQKDKDVICIYCSMGKESAAVKKVINDLTSHQAMEYTIIVAAFGKDSPGLNFLAPYSAMTMAEHFMENGRDVLVVFDDLTRHAWSYRELSLLLRRPPTREAYPGDIFYIHSRLLERATRLKKEKGGGSITALPIIETEEQNISAYVPTNLISITDGQIYLSPDLFQQGILPAIDVGKSVSRVGGKTQLPVYRKLLKDLKLAYAQFEELEAFSRFGTRLDEETKAKLLRGRRVREVLKQNRLDPLKVAEQIALLRSLTKGWFDRLELAAVASAKTKIRNAIHEKVPEICQKINRGEEWSEEEEKEFMGVIEDTIHKTKS
ncbi:MAG: alternate F1F0 ATPase, F1 subunit alpha [Simkaniaceae bacterium]